MQDKYFYFMLAIVLVITALSVGYVLAWLGAHP